MNCLKFLKSFIFLFLLLGFAQTMQAQDNAQHERELELINSASEASPKIFAYNETPTLVFGRYGKNLFKDFNENQLAVLEEYSYPIFVSHGKVAIEKDIMVYKQACKEWEIANEHLTEEIRTKIGQGL